MLDDEASWTQRLDGGAFALLFGAAVMSCMFGVGMVSGLVAMVVLAVQGREPEPDALYELLYQPAVLGPVTLVQMAAIFAVVVAFTHLRGGGWRERWAVRSLPGLPLAGAILAGLTIGPVAGYVAQEMVRIFEPLGLVSAAHLEAMGLALTEGPLLPRLPLMVAVLFGAPLVEELVFRGLLWSALEDKLPPVAVWLITSLGFAAYHMDPLHSVAILSTSLLLGWLRLSTGSIKASVAAHFANNVNGVVWIFVFGPGTDTPVSVAVALLCLVASVVACMTLVAGRRDPVVRG